MFCIEKCEGTGVWCGRYIQDISIDFNHSLSFTVGLDTPLQTCFACAPPPRVNEGGMVPLKYTDKLACQNWNLFTLENPAHFERISLNLQR